MLIAFLQMLFLAPVIGMLLKIDSDLKDLNMRIKKLEKEVE